MHDEEFGIWCDPISGFEGANGSVREVHGHQHTLVHAARRFLDDEHRNVAEAHDTIGGRAREQLLEAALSGLPNNDQLGAKLVGLVDDGGEWLANLDVTADASALILR